MGTEILIVLGVFVLTVLLVEEGYFVVRTLWNPELKNIQRRLRSISSAQYSSEILDIEKKKYLSEMPWLNRLLLKVPGIGRIDLALEQANTPYPMGFYLLLSLLFFASGAYATSFFFPGAPAVASAALILFFIPPLYIRTKRSRRMRKFQRQLPEALELMARSLKAGHALNGGIRMVVEEFEDPMGTEFEKTLSEINYGLGVPEALRNLAGRVVCDDLKLFTISVIIQRESGGNLAEILENLSRLIRERFKLQGRVRVLASEGKLSALILTLLPFLIVGLLFFINPGYISVLAEDPLGRLFVGAALTGTLAGIYVMKRIITIQV